MLALLGRAHRMPGAAPRGGRVGFIEGSTPAGGILEAGGIDSMLSTAVGTGHV